MDTNELKAKIEQCSKKVNSVAKNIIDTSEKIQEYECSPPVETKEMLDRCRSFVEKYSQYVEQISLYGTVMEKLKSEYDFTDNDLEYDITEHEKILEAEKKKHKNKKKPSLLQEYDDIIASFENPANDSEIIATESSQNYVDPITKQPIKNPVRNKLCGHIYEKSTMETVITNNPRTRCPIVGCGNREHIKLSDLCIDEELKSQLAN